MLGNAYGLVLSPRKGCDVARAVGELHTALTVWAGMAPRLLQGFLGADSQELLGTGAGTQLKRRQAERERRRGKGPSESSP